MSQPAYSPTTPITPSPHTPSWSTLPGGSQTWYKNLPKTIATIATTLAANSEEWKSRIHALQEIEKIVLDCLEYDRTTSSSTTSLSFNSILSTHMLTLAPALIVQITDLRSEIVRQASHTLSFLANYLPDLLTIGGESIESQGAFHKCGVKVLPALLTVAASSNSVMRTYAVGAAQDVVANVCSAGASSPGGGILGHLLNEFKTTKNKNVKSLTMELLGETIMKRWPRKIWSMEPPMNSNSKVQIPGITTTTLEEYLLLGLSSADTQTRAAACRAVWLYARYGNPIRASAFYATLELRTRKGIMDARKAEDDGVILDENAMSENGSSADDMGLTRSMSASQVKKSNTISRTLTDEKFSSSSSSSNISLSATSISDSILTKALADARKKTNTHTSANGSSTPGAPSSSSSGAKRVAPTVGTTTTAAAAAAAASAGNPPQRKLSGLGLPSRVPTKKPVGSATPIGKMSGTLGRVVGGADTPPSPTPMQVELMSALEADAVVANQRGKSITSNTSGGASATSSAAHSRKISMIQLDNEEGLLNDTELVVDGVVTNVPLNRTADFSQTNHVDNGEDVAASSSIGTTITSSLSSSSSSFAPPRTPSHLKSLSVSSSSSDLSYSIRGAATGTRTPKGTGPVKALPTNGTTTTGGTTSKRTNSSTLAAQALLTKTTTTNAPSTAASSSTQLSGAKSLSNSNKKRPASAAPTSGSKMNGAATAPTTGVVPSRRLGSSSSSSTLKRPISSTSAAATSSSPIIGVLPADEPITPRKRGASASAVITPSSTRRPASAATTSSMSTPQRSMTPGRTKVVSTPPSGIPRSSKSPGRPIIMSTPTTTTSTATGSPIAPSSSSKPPNAKYPSPSYSPGSVIASINASSAIEPHNSPSSSTLPAPALTPEMSLLLRDHRLHVSDSALHLQLLNSLLTTGGTASSSSSTTTSSSSSSTTPSYVDSMIRALSEHLAKTTKLLEGFMNVRRKEISANKAAAAAAAAASASATTSSSSNPPNVIAPTPILPKGNSPAPKVPSSTSSSASTSASTSVSTTPATSTTPAPTNAADLAAAASSPAPTD